MQGLIRFLENELSARRSVYVYGEDAQQNRRLLLQGYEAAIRDAKGFLEREIREMAEEYGEE